MLPSSPQFSIIICSHNPPPVLLEKTLEAVLALDTGQLSVEILIVDNNSQPALSQRPALQAFLKQQPAARCILQPRQGLLHARLKGISEALGKYIVFFDDDNLPRPDYLQVLNGLYAAHKQVAAWGPGKVDVDFFQGVSAELSDPKTLAYGLNYFQQYTATKLQFSADPHWQEHYPYGTGLSIKREYLLNYRDKVMSGEYRATGRNANLLSSGEDLQMVLSCIAQGGAAGRSPQLQLLHLIPKSRTRLEYLKRLVLGTSLAFYPSTCAVFPALKESLDEKPMGALRFQRKIAVKFLKARLRPNPVRNLELIRYVGVQLGGFQVRKKPFPRLALKILNALGLNASAELRLLSKNNA